MSSPGDDELIPVIFNCTGGQARIQARFTAVSPLDATWAMHGAQMITPSERQKR